MNNFQKMKYKQPKYMKTFQPQNGGGVMGEGGGIGRTGESENRDRYVK